jgi:hypothetical protein
VTYDEVYKNIERIKDNPVRQSTTDLKHMIFGDLDFLEINTNYNTRLKSI